MNGIIWSLVNMLSRILEPDEQDAVCGDLKSAGRALLGLVGLIIRRQLALWNNWRPWLALLGIVLVCGMILSESVFLCEGFLYSRLDAYVGSVEHWNGETWSSVPDGHDFAFLLCLSLALAAWSWVNGFVLGSLSGRTIWFTGLLFYFVVLDSFWVRLAVQGHVLPPGAHPPLARFILVRLRVLPIGIPMHLMFLLPAAWGMMQGLRSRTVTGRQSVIVGAVIANLTLLLTWMSLRYYHDSSAWGAPTLSWKTLLMSWSLLYMIANRRLRTVV